MGGGAAIAGGFLTGLAPNLTVVRFGSWWLPGRFFVGVSGVFMEDLVVVLWCGFVSGSKSGSAWWPFYGGCCSDPRWLSFLPLAPFPDSLPFRIPAANFFRQHLRASFIYRFTTRFGSVLGRVGRF